MYLKIILCQKLTETLACCHIHQILLRKNAIFFLSYFPVNFTAMQLHAQSQHITHELQSLLHFKTPFLLGTASFQSKSQTNQKNVNSICFCRNKGLADSYFQCHRKYFPTHLKAQSSATSQQIMICASAEQHVVKIDFCSLSQKLFPVLCQALENTTSQPVTQEL